MFSSKGTERYEERGQGYRDVEKVGKHCSIQTELLFTDGQQQNTTLQADTLRVRHDLHYTV